MTEEKKGKYEILDYIWCAICEHTEHYTDDGTFICTFDENHPEPLENACDNYNLGEFALAGTLQEIVKKLKEFEQK